MRCITPGTAACSRKHLADQPLMQAVLSDMALHVEASIALVMRLCRSFDRAPDDAGEAAYMRLLTPAIKYWVCKSAPGFLYEAMECLGGNGYVEEGILARHYRESPVNAIWEGSGNVMCLDVLRALSREAEAAAAVLRDLAEETQGPAGRKRGGRVHRQGLPPAGRRARRPARGREAGAARGRGRAEQGVAASRRIVRGYPARRQSRQHVRRGRSRPCRCPPAAGPGAAVKADRTESRLRIRSLPQVRC